MQRGLVSEKEQELLHSRQQTERLRLAKRDMLQALDSLDHQLTAAITDTQILQTEFDVLEEECDNKLLDLDATFLLDLQRFDQV